MRKIWSLASSPLIRSPVVLRKSVRGWEQSLGVKCLPSMVYIEPWVGSQTRKKRRKKKLCFLSLKFFNQKSKFHSQLLVPAKIINNTQSFKNIPFSDTQKIQLNLKIMFVLITNGFLPSLCVWKGTSHTTCVLRRNGALWVLRIWLFYFLGDWQLSSCLRWWSRDLCLEGHFYSCRAIKSTGKSLLATPLFWLIQPTMLVLVVPVSRKKTQSILKH